MTVLFVLLFLLVAGDGWCQTPAPPAPTPPDTSVFLRNLTRFDIWDFFEPRPGGGNPDYTYAANRLLVGIRRVAPRYEATAALQYVQFGGLPTDAIGPGPLGLGAIYFAQGGRTDSRHVYLKTLTLRLKDLVPGFHVQLGRMAYASGAEAASGDARIEAVKRQRLDSRMVGEFEWSLYQRAYDGVRIDVARPGWSATAFAARPTQGGFEDAAGLTIDDITVVAGSVSFKPARPLPHTDWQLFGYRYDDNRAVRDRPDNSGRPSARVDVGITTFGTSLVTAVPRPSGTVDTLVWAAAQTGSWFGQDHRAYGVAGEIGHQWTAVAGRPWVRGGYLFASGDDDPADDRHDTFFQMLPTVRRFSQTATYSQMNMSDVFAQLLLQPHPRVSARVDVHRLALASAADRWYFGSGATQETGTTFGFGTRPSNGATRLGTTVEGSAAYTIGPHLSINGFLGIFRGGDVVARSFAGRTLTFAYLETLVQF